MTHARQAAERVGSTLNLVKLRTFLVITTRHLTGRARLHLAVLCGARGEKRRVASRHNVGDRPSTDSGKVRRRHPVSWVTLQQHASTLATTAASRRARDYPVLPHSRLAHAQAIHPSYHPPPLYAEPLTLLCVLRPAQIPAYLPLRRLQGLSAYLEAIESGNPAALYPQHENGPPRTL
ncbi:hypothetical protein K458DRAFT_27635 [Lentithecium fluviatile CBS 122367]|uniref:Uncharacterized protein n=1 Tax=Lentithecium fluviatile CBS 122367 TaxID=1168545 RepID=A0A6G1J3N7_9PLEO|nr:hypothetical protein K458DRAFT_27635 [Lentithecium fluviatile CBS 122367]